MSFSTTIWNRVFTTSLATAAVALGSIFLGTTQAAVLNSAKSTFQAPRYEKYAREILNEYSDWKVNYQGIGSSGDIRQVFESLKTSKIAKVLDQSSTENNFLKFESILDLSKIQSSDADESQQVQKLLEAIKKQPTKVADCTIVWCQECAPDGCWICI
ncbi:hypothetical protein [Calothrix sp. PCC 7507]|uniref:hypothetical protein n=1 Tax=Calothrix sp. PCC 7507 TaxID=99598 RepID=UPI00029EEBBA|nr:hypothetical protein [Calothrix sp. PCC 7507]AFY32770.1 hypothetical protein Cal7507_2339 [Calothrix sp. PCC 7507]